MDAIEALEARMARDPFTPLREHLAHNDDQLLEDLVAMRKAKELTQEQVAERMNRSKTAVSNFERLGSDPHLSTIRRYAAAVGACITTRVADFETERESSDDLNQFQGNEAFTMTVRQKKPRTHPEENRSLMWMTADA